MNYLVTIADMAAARQRLAGVTHKTPVLTSRTVNGLVNSQVSFKCENFQRTGPFKFRGAYNALTQLDETQKRRGLLAHSSGNHAQAIALAGKLLNIRTTIVMPDDAPAVKLAAAGLRCGSHSLQPCGNYEGSRSGKTENRKTTHIDSPYDHPHAIAGQGTAAKELIEEVGDLDLLLVCCGGGGLLSGSEIAAKALLPKCRVIGTEPERADDATRSFHAKTLQTVHNPDTIADGARTPSLGQIAFPLVLHYVDEMVTVSEDAIKRTMFFLWERMKIVVEPTGVLAAAALLEGVITAPNAKIGVILTGGNVDLKQACQLFS